MGPRRASSLIWLVFAAIALWLAWSLWASERAHLRDRFASAHWVAEDCTITGYSRRDDDITVPFAYKHAGTTYRGSQTFACQSGAESLRVIAAYKSAPFRCLVDPSDPRKAMLDRLSAPRGMWVNLTAATLLFTIGAAIAGGVMWNLWGARNDRDDSAASSIGIMGVVIGWLFGGIFLVVGSAMVVGLGLLPLWRVHASASWVATPCTILESSVKEVSSGKGGKSEVAAVVYAYEAGGKKRFSDRVSFSMQGGPADAARFSQGMVTTCYVDPSDPDDAVLRRDSAGWLHVWPIAFGLCFMGGGILIVRQGLEPAARRRRRAHGSGELKPEWTPWGSAVATAALNLFWNGITGVFVWRVVLSHAQGRPEWATTFVVIPFALIGALLLFAGVSAVLVAFNPRIRLERETRGESGGLIRWRIEGDASRYSNLGFELVERITTGSGKGRRTVDGRILPLWSSRGAPTPTGEFAFRLPADARFDDESAWVVRIRGTIPGRWPDTKVDHPL